MSEGARARPFFKVSAGGNDFIVIDAREESEVAWDAPAVKRACTRRLSLGADGLVLLAPSTQATARFVLHNADGSWAAFSGNGARAAARVLAELGADRAGGVTLETVHGVLAARVQRDGASPRVEVELPVPGPLEPYLTLPSGTGTGDFADVGVPYLAVPVEDVDALDLPVLAPPLRRWERFREGANVAFYEPPEDPSAPVRLRTWERGVEGETLSSGTGCAIVAVSVGHRTGAVEGDRLTRFATRARIPVSVRATWKGGRIAALALEGDARLVARGELHDEGLAGFDP